MSNKCKQFTEEQRRDAVQYVEDHPNLTIRQYADNLGIGLSTRHRMKGKAKNSSDSQQDFIGSGHYSSTCEKENAQLKRELRDTQEA